jgi:hypothetical protein
VGDDGPPPFVPGDDGDGGVVDPGSAPPEVGLSPTAPGPADPPGAMLPVQAPAIIINGATAQNTEREEREEEGH